MDFRWLALALLIGASPAWGQSEEEVKAAMGKEIGAYANCLRDHVEASAKGGGTPEDAADQAFEACHEKQQGLWEKLQEPPLNDSADQATGEVQKMLDTLRPQMIEHFKKTKMGN
jgi:hypothetical protein